MKRQFISLLVPTIWVLGLHSSALAQNAVEPPLVTEARQFMIEYANDLRSGDRAGIANRYDEGGAWIVQSGTARAVTHDQVVNRYRDAWEPPAAFAWGDLIFVPAGADAVVVIGRFDWTPAEGETERMSYNGLLARTATGLRIRIEDEAPIPDEED